MIATNRSLAEDIQIEIDIPARIQTFARFLSPAYYGTLQEQIVEQGAKLDPSKRPAFEARSWEAIFGVLRRYRDKPESTRLQVAQQCVRNVRSLLDGPLSYYAGTSCERPIQR